MALHRLTQAEREEIVRQHRRTTIAFGVVVAALVVILILVIASNADSGYRYLGGGGGIGVLIGLLITIPRRRLYARLGITGLQATQVLTEERDRRTGRDQLPAAVRAVAEQSKMRTFQICGALLLVPLVVGIGYVAVQANKTYVEGQSSAPFAAAFFGGFVALIAAIMCFAAASGSRRAAERFKTLAAYEDTADGGSGNQAPR